jgi:hypothetical protein
MLHVSIIVCLSPPHLLHLSSKPGLNTYWLRTGSKQRLTLLVWPLTFAMVFIQKINGLPLLSFL